MTISNPQVVIDVSGWDYRLNVKELQDGGVYAVIIKSGQGMKRDVRFVKHATACAEAGMPIMAYHWDDITMDPVAQAEWCVADIAATGLPVKFVWADQEQWWTNWDAWYKARAGKLPWSLVPRASGVNISEHCRRFMERLNFLINSGGYDGYGFVTTYAPQMSKWLGTIRLWAPHWKIQPPPGSSMSWEDFKARWLPNYTPLVPPGTSMGLLYGHQFTGDRVKLPGVYDSFGRRMPLDVSVFDGAWLAETLAGGNPQPPAPPEDLPLPPTGVNYIVNVAALNVRSGPATSFPVRYVVYYQQIIQVKSITGNWALLADGNYCYAPYLVKES
jgi:hypothetical protein